MSPDANLKSTWSSIFSRKGGAGDTTRLWDDWDDSAQTAALSEITLEPEELPVILMRSRSGNSIVLTTRRLICHPNTAPVREIINVKPAEFIEKKKEQLNQLDIEFSGEKPLRITVEPGSSYFGLWNVLLHIVRRNANRPLAS